MLLSSSIVPSADESTAYPVRRCVDRRSSPSAKVYNLQHSTKAIYSPTHRSTAMPLKKVANRYETSNNVRNGMAIVYFSLNSFFLAVFGPSPPLEVGITHYTRFLLF